MPKDNNYGLFGEHEQASNTNSHEYQVGNNGRRRKNVPPAKKEQNLEIFDHLLQGDTPAERHQGSHNDQKQNNMEIFDNLLEDTSAKVNYTYPQRMEVFGELDDEPESAPQTRAQKKAAKKAAKEKAVQKENERGYKPKKPKKTIKQIIGRTIACVVLLGIAGVGVMGGMILHSTRNDDLWLDLEQIPYKTSTIIYGKDDATGEAIEYASIKTTQDKTYVSSDEIPEDLKNAIVAVEDKNFYTHHGISVKRTIFAVLNEVKHAITGSYIGGDAGMKQGASTIDQQLVKNLTGDDENEDMAGYMRKLREMYRAVKMDYAYEKDDILSAYLNTISFTGNTAGVQSASEKLFGKPVNELTLVECASLAAIPRSPSYYSPVSNPENHLERRNHVLYEMWQQEYISEEEYNAAVNAPLELNYQGEPEPDETINSYFTDIIIQEVTKALVEEKGITSKQAVNLLYNGGLRIYATVVPQLQQSMEQTMENGWMYPRVSQTIQQAVTDENGMPVLDENGEQLYEKITVYPEAAMISLDYDGGICAVVGGLGEKEINLGLNRATSTLAARQVGSTMKAIGPYAVALENNKINWSTPFYDGPVKQIKNENTGEMIDWPINVTNTYSERNILVADAFADSVNTVAVRVGEAAGVGNMYRFVKNDLEIPTFDKSDKDLGPLVMGSSTYGITPLEMAKSFAMFGDGGYITDPYSFTKLTNGTGTTTFIQTKVSKKQVISSDTAYVMNRLMREVMVNGTAAGMGVPGEMDTVGKTGTTSEYKDHWFMGLTPYYVTASWYGYDTPAPLPLSRGSNPPVAAWREVMSSGQQGLTYRDFPVDSSVITQRYCTVSGGLAGDNCPSAEGYYRMGELPQICTEHM